MFPTDSSLVLLVFILLKGTRLAICEVPTDSAYKQLRDHLLKGYDNKVRPVLEHSQTTVVTFSLAPVHIADMDEKQSTLRMDLFADLSWEDEHLKWKPEDYFGIKKVHFRSEDIWKPDLKVFNGRSFLTTPWMFGGLSVNSSGRVSWLPSALMYPICKDFDYKSYPNDVQICELLLGSWTTSQNEIEFLLKESTYGWDWYYFNKSNPHWEITNFSGKKLEYKDQENVDQVMVKYEIEMKRVNVPHMALGSIPDTVARILLLCMFWLPDLTKKLLVGLTSIFILTSVADSINSLLPSPAAAPAALAEITAALGMGITAIILEIILSTVADWTGDFPPLLSGLANMRFFQALRSCAQKGHSISRERISELKEVDGGAQVRLWTVLAFLFEKILFVIFGVLLLAV